MALRIFTLGHSILPFEKFLEILQSHGIRQVIDVRSIPKSRRHPQFGQESLRESLKRAGIGYVWMKGLGGLRHPKKDSPNTAWRNKSFQGYADYMQSAEFQAELEQLTETAAQAPSALLCAEAVPWRCHRSLIGDALSLRGAEVLDILSASQARPHRLTPFARWDGQRLTYPADPLFASPQK